MPENAKKITIFTPTYNRAHTLPRLYNSLKKQNEYSFHIEWLIVDDGSTDNTEKIVRAFQSEEIIKISYIKKKNGGKHTALNVGIKNAKNEYFFCVDSDDYLQAGAIKHLVTFINEYDPDAIIAYKSNIDTQEQIGSPFPKGLTETTLYTLINQYKCNGDRSLIYRTDLIREITIPEPSGVKFFPETYLYDRFDEKYTSLLLERDLCKCQYLSGGYSNSFRKLMIDNALSMKWFYGERINMKISFKERFTYAYRYLAYTFLAKSNEYTYKGHYAFYFILALPLGIAMYIFYILKKS